jgi:hypothetical protein
MRLWSVMVLVAIVATLLVVGAQAGTALPSDPTTAARLANVAPTVAAPVTAVRTTSAGLPSAGSSASVSGVRPATTTGGPCWYVGYGAGNDLHTEWGVWPYQQKVIEWRQWCAQYIGGPQTYRVSEVHLSTTLCAGSNRYVLKTGGGNGLTYTNVETGAHFDCQTDIPWIIIHEDRWQIWQCNTRGDCVRLAHE